ncbi:hypothetical protein AB6D77_08050 [Vibrio splendidus]
MKILVIASLIAAASFSSVAAPKMYQDFTQVERTQIDRDVNAGFSQYAGTQINEVTTLQSMLLLNGIITVTSVVDPTYYGNTPLELRGIVQDFASNQTNTVCTNPSLRGMINVGIDYKYTYYTKNGTYIGEYSITRKDCKQ